MHCDEKVDIMGGEGKSFVSLPAGKQPK